jgi:hypothetical protein
MLPWAFNFLKENSEKALRIFRLAPGATVAAVLIVGIILYTFFQFRYSTIIEQKDAEIAALEQRVKLRDDQLADKLHSTPPSEAKAMIEALEARLNQLSPRRVKDSEKSILIEKLRLPSGISYTAAIMHDGACTDCNTFATDFSSLFRTSGWNVINSIGIGISNMAPTGIAVRVGDQSKLTEAQRIVIAALKAANILFDVQSGGFPIMQSGGVPNPDVGLVITAKTTS